MPRKSKTRSLLPVGLTTCFQQRVTVKRMRTKTMLKMISESPKTLAEHLFTQRHWSCRGCVVASWLALACLVSTPSAESQEIESLAHDNRAVAERLQDALVEVIGQLEPCVVAIRRAPEGVNTGRQSEPFSGFAPMEFPLRTSDPFQPSGVGVVISDSGLILTQYLNVRAGDQHQVTTTDGQQLAATIKAADPRSGLAVLEVGTGKLIAVKMGDADKLRKGHFVVTVGNPQSIVQSGEPSASWGTVTNLAQRAAPTTNLNNTHDETGDTFATTLHHLGTLLQTDARLNWGAGGGPVVDLSGQLVGITTTASTLPGHEAPAGYAIPMTSVFRRIVDDLSAGREVEYGLLGLRLDDASRRSGGEATGALVSLTVPGGSAQRAGIRNDDLLIEIDGQAINTVSELQLLVGSLPPGQPVNVGLMRSGQRMDLPVSLSKLYVPGEKIFTAPKQVWRGMQVDYSTAISLPEIQRAAEASLIDPAGCVVVASVEPHRAGDSAGVEPGMFISHVGDQRVSTPAEFYAAVAEAKDVVNLRFTSSSAGDQRVEKQVEENLPKAKTAVP